MASTTAAPKLQIAQILADLSDLYVADPTAALNLVTAQRAASPPKRTRSSASNTSLPRSLSNSLNMSGSMSTSASRLDRIGSQGARGFRSPSLTSPAALPREESTASMKSAKSNLESPNASFRVESDPDMERAEALLALYESRGRMKQKENVGLTRARANVEAVGERYRNILESSSSRRF